MPFKGWSPEAFEFYVGLEADNSKAFWTAHRDIYDSCVKVPFDELGASVEREFGPMRLFRPYRDTRFAKDKSPYKTSAAAVTEGEGGTRYYVQISAEGLYVGAGYYHLESDQLERWRKAVDDKRSGPKIEQQLAALERARYDTNPSNALKTAPRGFTVDHPRIGLLRRKGVHAGRAFGAPKWVSTKTALDRIVGVWRDTKPMNDWLDKYVGPSELAPEAPD